MKHLGGRYQGIPVSSQEGMASPCMSLTLAHNIKFLLTSATQIDKIAVIMLSNDCSGQVQSPDWYLSQAQIRIT